MMTAAVVLDTWKLKTFKTILDREGFAYAEQHDEPFIGMVTLSVLAQSAGHLAPFIKEANDAAARSRMN